MNAILDVPIRPFLKVNQSTSLLVQWGRKSALIRWGKTGLRHQRSFENRSERLRVEITRTLHSNCRLRRATDGVNFYYFSPPLFISTNGWCSTTLSSSLIWRLEQRLWIIQYVLFIVKCVFYYFSSQNWDGVGGHMLRVKNQGKYLFEDFFPPGLWYNISHSTPAQIISCQNFYYHHLVSGEISIRPIYIPGQKSTLPSGGRGLGK